LQGIKVTDVGDVDEAKEADDGVDEDDEGQALVLLIQHDEAREREEELGSDHTNCSHCLVGLVKLIEHIKLPPPGKHPFTHIATCDSLWQPVIVSLWNIAMLIV